MKTEIYGKLLAVVITIIFLQVGCSAEIKKNDDHDSSGNVHTSDYYNGTSDSLAPFPVSQLSYLEGKCTVKTESIQYQYSDGYATYYGKNKYLCYENTDYRWRTNCTESGCFSTKIFVHYMLTKDIGENLTVQIEAFDNKYFEGYPKGTVEIRQFKGQTGYSDEAELYLPKGDYYLRAYVNTDDKQPVPYKLEGMELVADKPVGV